MTRAIERRGFSARSFNIPLVDTFRQGVESQRIKEEQVKLDGRRVRAEALDRFFTSAGEIDTSFPRATYRHGAIAINVSTTEPYSNTVIVTFDSAHRFREGRISLSITDKTGLNSARFQDNDLRKPSVPISLTHEQFINLETSLSAENRSTEENPSSVSEAA